MSQRVVAVAAVHEFCNGFVCGKLEGGEGDGHGEGGGVRDVEGAEALVAEDGACALGERCVDTSVYLHALLNDCNCVSRTPRRSSGTVAYRQRGS